MHHDKGAEKNRPLWALVRPGGPPRQAVSKKDSMNHNDPDRNQTTDDEPLVKITLKIRRVDVMAAVAERLRAVDPDAVAAVEAVRPGTVSDGQKAAASALERAVDRLEPIGLR